MEISKIWIFVFIFYGSLEVGAQDTKNTTAPNDAQAVQTTTERVWILTNENKSPTNTPTSEVKTQDTNGTAATEKVWPTNMTGDVPTDALSNSTESPNSAGTPSNYSGSSTTTGPSTTTGAPSNYTGSNPTDDSSNSTGSPNSNTTSNSSGSGNDTSNTSPEYYYDSYGHYHYYPYHKHHRGWRWIVVGVCSFFVFTIFWIIFCKCCLGLCILSCCAVSGQRVIHRQRVNPYDRQIYTTDGMGYVPPIPVQTMPMYHRPFTAPPYRKY